MEELLGRATSNKHVEAQEAPSRKLIAGII